MYIITCDGNLLYDPRVDELKVANAKLQLEVNRSGSFDFTIYPAHPLYGTIQKLKSVIEVYQDGVLLFRGRVLNDRVGLFLNKEIECEGDLAFFNDTIMRPFEYTGNLVGFIQSIIDNHNAQAGADKQFTLGNVTVTDSNDFITRSSIEYQTSWEVIENRLIKNLGGYIRVRRSGGVNYLDYLADSTTQSLQELKLEENILDVIKDTRSDTIITALIPLGAKLTDKNGNETDQRLTIASVNGGLDYVHNAAAVTQYGWIFGTKTWDNVTDPNNLLTRANQELAVRINLGVSVELKAIDLSMIPVVRKNIFDSSFSDLTKGAHASYITFENNNIIVADSRVPSPRDVVAFYNTPFYLEKNVQYTLTKAPYTNFVATITCLALIPKDRNAGDSSNYFSTTDSRIIPRYSFGNSSVFTFTPTWSGEYRLGLYLAYNKPPFTIHNVDFQIEKGTVATSYEPYKPSIDEIRVFEYVQVTSEPHGINTMALITKLSINLLDPKQNTFTLGFSYDTFTDKQVASENALRQIQNDYVTNQTVQDVRSSLQTVSSNIQQEADKIRTEVSATYTSKSELDQYKSQVSTQFTQTSTDYTFLFSQLNQFIQTLDAKTQTQFNEIVKYIRFVGGNIELGEINNPIKLILQNNRISFTQNGAEVAYISDNILYITDGRFLNSLRIGNFAFTPRSNGSLSFGKVV